MSETDTDWLQAYESGAVQTSDLASSTQLSLWTAMGGLVCAAVGPFTCYMSYLAALPLCLVAVWSSWKVVNAPAAPDDAELRAYRSVSYAGMVGGIMGAIMSGFFLLILGLVMLMYVAIFFFAMIGAMAGS